MYTCIHVPYSCVLTVSTVVRVNLPPGCWHSSGLTWILECASSCTPRRRLLNVCSQILQSRWTHTEPGSFLHLCSAHCLARYGLEQRGAEIHTNGHVFRCRWPVFEGHGERMVTFLGRHSAYGGIYRGSGCDQIADHKPILSYYKLILVVQYGLIWKQLINQQTVVHGQEMSLW